MKIVRAARGLWAALLISLLSVLSSSQLTSVASAQSPQQTALARSLFEEGVKRADRGDWVGAADRFGRAYSLKPTPGIAFNWARAQSETGHLLHARELLRDVLRDAGADPALKRESESLLTTLDARIARLRVSTAREPSEATQIEVDGNSWPRAAWGFPSPIDPGEHEVVCSEHGEEIARVKVTLREGESRDLTLGERRDSSAADPSDALAGGQRAASQKRPLYKSWVFWGAVGAVVVGGTVTALMLANKRGRDPATPVAGNTMPGVIRW